MNAAPIVVIAGQLAAGKSTVARAVLDRFPHGYHIEVDVLREMVISGRASPLEWTDETSRQFDLALDAATALARIYHHAGFAVAIDGAFDPVVLERNLDRAGLQQAVVGLVLHPRLGVALDRNRSRTSKPFDPEILERTINALDVDLASQRLPAGWELHDNSDETIDETANWVLDRIAAAGAEPSAGEP